MNIGLSVGSGQSLDRWGPKHKILSYPHPLDPKAGWSGVTHQVPGSLWISALPWGSLRNSPGVVPLSHFVHRFLGGKIFFPEFRV